MAATVIDICERVERRELNMTSAALALIAIGIDKEDAFIIEQLCPKSDDQVLAPKPHEESLADLREAMNRLVTETIFAPIVEAAQDRNDLPDLRRRVTDGVTVEDGTRRLRVSAAGIVAEVVKDQELPEPERDEQAWQAAGTAIARELRAHHRAGRL